MLKLLKQLWYKLFPFDYIEEDFNLVLDLEGLEDIMDFELWLYAYEEELHTQFATSGQDKEPGFDFNKAALAIYNKL